MDPKERAKILRAIAKEYGASEDVPFDISDFIDPSKKTLLGQALNARNLMEDALAEQVLMNTGIPIPDFKKATIKQKEKFASDIFSEYYPELKNDIRVVPNLTIEDVNNQGVKKLTPVDGIYFAETGKIKLRDTDDIHSLLGTTFHEGAHGYDKHVVNYDGPDDLLYDDFVKNIEDYNTGKTDKKLNPGELYDVLGKGHHAQIPGKRDGKTFGAGALKSYLKSGKFKSLLPGALTAGAAAMAGSASDALADVVVPGGVEGVGEGSDKSLSDTQDRDLELTRDISKNNDTLTQTRLKALQRMLGK
jgi:hypothetical protein